MKQLGNLAVACARRPDVMLQLYAGTVSVFVGAGPERAVRIAPWEDDEAISRIVQELNFGTHDAAKERSAA